MDGRKQILVGISIAVVVMAIFVLATSYNNESAVQPLAQSSADKYDHLYYNKSTGEMYPTLPSEAHPHTCVWTIWGDHGSQTILVTEQAWISAEAYPDLQRNGFLPPRVPIYVTCVDWENMVYQGRYDPY
jgi:hypothetical protein